MSIEARAYLDDVLDLLQRRSIRREAVDWAALRRDARALAEDARSTADTYPAIKAALERLGDRHSVFLTPQQVRHLREGRAQWLGLTLVHPEGTVARVFRGTPAAEAGVREGEVIERLNGVAVATMDRVQMRAALRAPSVELRVVRPGESEARTLTLRPAVSPMAVALEARTVATDVGYIDVPEIGGADEQRQAYARSVQQLIRALDPRMSLGWIVDLRRNTGGNMWPMLAGLGPLAGEGEIGAFAYPDRVTPWGYRAGQAYLGERIMAEVEDPYAPERPPTVAVLTSRLTASSGELVLLAFRDRPHTRTFGEPTAGVPTVNDDVFLSDGAGLFLTVALGADRTGRTYDGPVGPDEPVAIDWNRLGQPDDPVTLAALGWLREHALAS